MVEPESGAVRTVVWAEVCPWLSVLRCFRLAISLRVLVLGAVGIFLTLAGWWVLGNVFYADALLPQPQTRWSETPWAGVDGQVPSEPFLGLVLVHAAPERMGGPVATTWAELSRPMRLAVITTGLNVGSATFLLLAGFWTLAVWAFFGGAISRIAVVQLAADEPVGWAAALRFARRKWLSYFAAPLLPLLGVLVAAVPLAILGLLMRAGTVGVIAIGVIWPLFLLAGLMMALLLLGLAFGWPLMWATISAEGTDAFDALSRSYAYLFQRPLRFVFYVFVAAVLGWLGWILVVNFAAGVIWLTNWAVAWGCGWPRMEMIEDRTLSGSGLIHFWIVCVKFLAVGFRYGYFWTAAAAIYLLLRRDVDATETDEVFLDADASELLRGLPPLATDEKGAPVVKEEG